jgi:PAS domain S-box-containing protein
MTLNSDAGTDSVIAPAAAPPNRAAVSAVAAPATPISAHTLLQQAFHANPDLISIERLADGRIAEANARFLRAAGLPREQVIGKRSEDLGLWADRALYDRMWRTLRAGIEMTQVGMRLRERDGGLLDLAYTATSIDLDGEPHVLLVGRDASARKRTEDALRASERRLRTVIDQAPFSIQIFSRDGVLREINGAWERLWGTRQPTQGYNILRDPQLVEMGLSPCVQHAFAGQTVSTPPTYYDPGASGRPGRARWVEAFLYPIKDDTGRVGEVVLGLQDVSARKETENALRESESQLRQMVDANLIGIALRNGDGTLIDANDLFLDMIGRSRDELAGRRLNWAQLAPPEYHADDAHALAFIQQQGRHQPYEKELLHADGHRVPVLVGAAAIDRGRIAAFVVNLSEHKRAEQKIRFQAHLLDVVGQAVVVTDRDGVVTYWNSAAENLFGWRSEEVLGKNVVAIGFVREPVQAIEAMKLLRCGERWSGEYAATHRDGRPLLVSANLVPLVDERGQVSGFIGANSDITARKKMEDDLIKAQKLESIGVLAGGIAHDFNNILTAMLGNIGLAKMFAKTDAQTTEVLTEAEKAFGRARDLTQQLLTFAKGGAPIRRVGSLAPVLRDASRFALTGANVRCECVIPEDLWSAGFDAGQISQVVNNLVINAKQAMPDSGIIRIRAENVLVERGRVASLRRGKYVKVTVSDTGCGIPRENLSKIFDPYFTTKRKGSGLGLATTYSIIKRHHGHIDVESMPGRGTSFYVYLPAIEDAAPEKEAAPLTPPRVGHGRVLLMDDDPAIRLVGGRLIAALGYDVQLAEDGNEAIARYIEARWGGEPFAAVILDLTVANGMGGRECIKKLRDIDPDVPALVSSGYSNDPVMAEHKKYGFRGVVAKPYQIKDLSDALYGIVGARTEHASALLPPEASPES